MTGIIRKFLKIGLSLIATALFYSCHPLYFAEPVSTPVFTKACQMDIGYMGGSSDADAQGAVSVTDHLALMGSYEFNDHSNNQQSTMTAGIEYFGLTGIPTPESVGLPLRYEIMAGMGTGYHKYFDYDTSRTQYLGDYEHDLLSGRIDFRKVYVQGVLGVTDRDMKVRPNIFGLKVHRSAGIALRFEYLDLYRVNTTTSFTSNYSSSSPPDLNDQKKRRNLNMEIALFSSQGLSLLQFYEQLGLYFPLAYDEVYVFPIQINFGLILGL